MFVFHSQKGMGQDQWVCDVLKSKPNGTFLDIGCGHYESLSNTLFFESCLNWRGIGVDNNPDFGLGWVNNRKSPFVCADAVVIDYEPLLVRYQMPEVIDYLTIDLEPPELALDALVAVLKTTRRFRCITFEHDNYRKTWTLAPSRKMLRLAGYELVREQRDQDDFWIAPDLVGEVPRKITDAVK